MIDYVVRFTEARTHTTGIHRAKGETPKKALLAALPAHHRMMRDRGHGTSSLSPFIAEVAEAGLLSLAEVHRFEFERRERSTHWHRVRP